MTKFEYMAACPYCGQMKTFESEIAQLPMDEQIDYVGKHCLCNGAERARKIRNTQDAIDNVLGEKCLMKGFDYECDDDVIGLVKNLVEQIIDGHLNNVSFMEPNGDTIKLNMGGDRVKIGRIMKKQVVM
jgi:hypothetical protein